MGELRDGAGPAVAELAEQREAGAVAEGGEGACRTSDGPSAWPMGSARAPQSGDRLRGSG